MLEIGVTLRAADHHDLYNVGKPNMSRVPGKSWHNHGSGNTQNRNPLLLCRRGQSQKSNSKSSQIESALSSSVYGSVVGRNENRGGIVAIRPSRLIKETSLPVFHYAHNPEPCR